MDMGSEEHITVNGIYMDYAGIVGDFYRHLLDIGYSAADVTFYVDPGGFHSEVCWARRFDRIATGLLNDAT